jgi:paraquat-inducible protein B
MNKAREPVEHAEHGPQAIVQQRRFASVLVWVVPLLAALIAGYLVFERVWEAGPSITIKFHDGTGVRAGTTQVQYRGVAVGDVTAVLLSADHNYVEVRVRMHRSAATMLREGATFWVVRPEVGLSSISGLSTVVTGPEIQMLPGPGNGKDNDKQKPPKEFLGLDSPPAAPDRKGLVVILHTARLGFLKPHSPVFYRGLEVGTVQATQLSPDTTEVNIEVFLSQHFAPLVRSGSRFWSVSGVELSGGIFKGLDLKLESLPTLITGGIEFATPDASPGTAVRSGTQFDLSDSAQKDWLSWSPHITLGKDEP